MKWSPFCTEVKSQVLLTLKFALLQRLQSTSQRKVTDYTSSSKVPRRSSAIMESANGTKSVPWCLDLMITILIGPKMQYYCGNARLFYTTYLAHEILRKSRITLSHYRITKH